MFLLIHFNTLKHIIVLLVLSILADIIVIFILYIVQESDNSGPISKGYTVSGCFASRFDARVATWSSPHLGILQKKTVDSAPDIFLPRYKPYVKKLNQFTKGWRDSEHLKISGIILKSWHHSCYYIVVLSVALYYEKVFKNINTSVNSIYIILVLLIDIGF